LRYDLIPKSDGHAMEGILSLTGVLCVGEPKMLTPYCIELFVRYPCLFLTSWFSWSKSSRDQKTFAQPRNSGFTFLQGICLWGIWGIWNSTKSSRLGQAQQIFLSFMRHKT